MQSFLVPADTSEVSFKTQDSKTPEVNSRSTKLKFGSMAVQRPIGINKIGSSSESSKFMQSIKSALLPMKKKNTGMMKGNTIIDFEVAELSEKSEE